jgi:integration host factor subunit beta
VLKSKLVRALNEKLPERQIRDVELALNCMLGQMADALDKGQRIEIRGFGSFDLPRIARNPKTGEAVNLPAKVAIHFKPGNPTGNEGSGECRTRPMRHRGMTFIYGTMNPIKVSSRVTCGAAITYLLFL